MNYEKKYNEALERAQKVTRAGSDVAMDIVQYIFPELAESEDERIRKELIMAFEAYDVESSWNGFPVKSILAWLEKQKEQKRHIEICPHSIKGKSYSEQKPVEWSEKDDIVSPPQNWDEFKEKHVRLSNAYMRGKADGIEFGRKLEKQMTNEWSEEDEEMIDSINRSICSYMAHIRTECAILTDKDKKRILDRCENECAWLEDRLKHFRPQPKQEWSEEDEEYRQELIDFIYGHPLEHTKKAIMDWIKSLPNRPKPSDTWKPSEEQSIKED